MVVQAFCCRVRIDVTWIAAVFHCRVDLTTVSGRAVPDDTVFNVHHGTYRY